MERQQKFYRVNDVAAILGLTISGARKLMQKEMPFYKIGKLLMVSKNDFEEWLSNCKKG